MTIMKAMMHAAQAVIMYSPRAENMAAPYSAMANAISESTPMGVSSMMKSRILNTTLDRLLRKILTGSASFPTATTAKENSRVNNMFGSMATSIIAWNILTSQILLYITNTICDVTLSSSMWNTVYI